MGPQSKDRGKTAPAIICIKILLHTFNLIYLVSAIIYSWDFAKYLVLRQNMMTGEWWLLLDV